MNTWMFETRRKYYNEIKKLIETFAFFWFLLHRSCGILRCFLKRLSPDVSNDPFTVNFRVTQFKFNSFVGKFDILSFYFTVPVFISFKFNII